MVKDRNSRVTSEHEIAVHAMDGEVRGDGHLCGCEALRDDGAAVDAARSGWVPEGSRVGEDVLWRMLALSFNS